MRRDCEDSSAGKKVGNWVQLKQFGSYFGYSGTIGDKYKVISSIHF